MKDYTKSSHIRIAVIDKDISKKYPENFVCILPRTFNPKSKNPNKFQEKYGNKSKQIIEELLNKALKSEEDQAIKKELLKRLQILNPKPKNIVKCSVCGEEFKARKYGYRLQKTCYGCLNKRRSNQT
jgi:hypothetical protein